MKVDKNKLWNFVKNKYVAVTLIFFVIILFLDQNNLFVIGRLSKEVKELRAEEDKVRRDMVRDSIHINSLMNNIDSVERFGREEYLMKRPDEDVYVFSK